MIEILAINITNLTDARYFAARGAKWIFYSLKDINEIPKIKAIQEWIDGPNMGVSIFQESNPEQIDLIITELEPAGIISSGGIYVEGTKNFVLTSNPVQNHKDAAIVVITENLKTITPENYLYKKYWTDQEILSINQLKLKGIIISGSEEDKTGLKNYDVQDKLLDEIEKVNYD